jgi:hypothetical protein
MNTTIQHGAPPAAEAGRQADFYRPIDFPPICSDAQRMRAIAALARQHFNAPSTISLIPE